MIRVATLALTTCVISAPPARITVHLAGDSTMAEKLPEKRPETGWGERLQEHFDSSRVRIVNHARNGRSTRTFIEEGRWQAIVDSLRPGDYVFIQFGHNDESKDKVDRYTPPDAYKANLRRFVADARAKRAIPVLLTPVVRRRFDSTGTFYDVHGEYPDLVRAVAAELRVPLLDMHRRSEALLRSYGPDRSRALFLQLRAGEHPNYPAGIEDNTHFSPTGAALMADLAVAAITDARLPLAKLLIRRDSARATRSGIPPVEHRRARVASRLVSR
jgi:lysophospholipase L1-like esterase